MKKVLAGITIAAIISACTAITVVERTQCETKVHVELFDFVKYESCYPEEGTDEYIILHDEESLELEDNNDDD